MPVDKIPVRKLTDLIYAFGEPGAGNVCHGPSAKEDAIFSKLRALRAAHPRLRLLLSIGGWGQAPQYSDAALTAQSRRAFARSCVDSYVARAGFDGIDVDWEFPVHGGVPQNRRRPQDRANITALLEELRRQLDVLARTTHRRYYLTAATPAGRWEYGGPYDPSDSYELARIATYVDWLNVMTYDMSTSFSPVSNFNAPMYADPKDPTPQLQRRYGNVAGAVEYYEQHGVPRDKIVLGIAFYGRGFSGVSAKNSGLYSKFAAPFPETPWATVQSQFLSDPSWQRFWSASAKAPWLYNARRRVFFSYDDPASIALKAQYARKQSLRGVMFCVLGEDDTHQSLLTALSSPFVGR